MNEEGSHEYIFQPRFGSNFRRAHAVQRLRLPRGCGHKDQR